jgi:hypothetical protein
MNENFGSWSFFPTILVQNGLSNSNYYNYEFLYTANKTIYYNLEKLYVGWNLKYNIVSEQLGNN